MKQIFENIDGTLYCKCHKTNHDNTCDDKDFKVEAARKERYVIYQEPESNDIEPKSNDIDVAFSATDFKFAFFMYRLLKHRAPKLTTNIHMKSYSERLSSIDNARLVVTFLYDNENDDTDELHVAIARQRSRGSKGSIVLYPIQLGELFRLPTFLHLLPCYIAVQDPQWTSLGEDADVDVAADETMEHLGESLSNPCQAALSAATDHIIAILNNK